MALKLRVLFANALAGVLDLCMGIFLTTALMSLAGQKPALWQLAIGALLAIVPDFDIVPTILLGREASGNHRLSLLHRPLVVLPTTAALAYALGGPVWLAITFACVTWHFVHDTPPLSLGGIAWAWPFDSRYWSWFGPKSLGDTAGLTHYEWLKRYWMRPSTLLLAELGSGVIALCAALVIALRAF